MKQLSGKISSSIKVLNLTPLVRFELTDLQNQKINCLVHQHALNFPAMAQPNSRIAIYAHYNKRHQFVVQKFMVQASENNDFFSHSA
ncbi:hypothetical protein [Pediococcus parvulus]|uniref:hypothetical protein n=1 Tax=Pediococcus parvulus TaxID=54062 RepID=UPI000710B51E|nr:hypothetical protein [Pediococcus parvulus]MCT3027386.1 hypothetical protein [Pediococcus parvulus]GEL89257.1 hypothetical protein PPA04_04880 [Pediococcus parvulus]GHC05993.1 hypothetical protein GCM10008912_06710 [Pediococcus parvulus]